MSRLIQAIRELEIADGHRERRAIIAAEVELLEASAADLRRHLAEARGQLYLANQEANAAKAKLGELSRTRFRLVELIAEWEQSAAKNPKHRIDLVWAVGELRGLL